MCPCSPSRPRARSRLSRPNPQRRTRSSSTSCTRLCVSSLYCIQSFQVLTTPWSTGVDDGRASAAIERQGGCVSKGALTVAPRQLPISTNTSRRLAPRPRVGRRLKSRGIQGQARVSGGRRISCGCRVYLSVFVFAVRLCLVNITHTLPAPVNLLGRRSWPVVGRSSRMGKSDSSYRLTRLSLVLIRVGCLTRESG